VPITYQLDRARGVIQTRCSGAATFHEVIEHFRALHADPEVTERLSVLLDLTELASVPERDQLRAIAGEVKDMRDRVQWNALSIVAPSDLLFGMSRVFGIFAEGHFAHTGVFRTRAEAERWLDARLTHQAGAA